MQIGLEEPLHTDVGHGRVVEFAAADSQVILEQKKEPVLVEDFPDDGLVNVAPLQGLLARSLGENVAHFLEDALDDLGRRDVLLVANGKRDLYLVHEK